MFVLVATHARLDIDPVDGHSPIDGELVIAPVRDCSCDDSCTCARAWHGVVSDGATPTALVARRPGITRDQLREALAAMMERNDWLDSGLGPRERDAQLELLVDDQLKVMSRILCEHGLGTVLTRDGAAVTPVDLGEAA